MLLILTLGLFAGNALAAYMPLTVNSNSDVTLNVVNSDLTGTRFDVTVPGIEMIDRSENRTQYSVLDIPGAGTLSEPGYPELPVIRRRVAVPDYH